MQVGKILSHVGLLPDAKPEDLKHFVEHAIADENGRFSWAR